MFFTIKSKNGNGDEALVNASAVSYVLPSLDGNCVIYFGEHFIVCLDSYKSIKEKIFTSLNTLEPVVISVKGEVTQVSLDEFPEELPRLPNGQVDKRTVQYKEYIAK